jgi:hypothetical protein
MDARNGVEDDYFLASKRVIVESVQLSLAKLDDLARLGPING